MFQMWELHCTPCDQTQPINRRLQGLANDGSVVLSADDDRGKPQREAAEATPGKRFVVWPSTSVSMEYASSAGAPARHATSVAASRRLP
jgi:hypothetical protein